MTINYSCRKFDFMKNRILTATLISLSLALGSAAVSAAPAETAKAAQPAVATSQTAPVQENVADQIRIRLMARIGANVSEVNPTPIEGLYEAVVGNDIVYVNESTDYLLMGQLFDTKTRRNLTEETKDRLSRIDFSTLPLDDAVKTVNGDGSRTIAVFSDPNCSFCKRLEVSLKELKNVTIYTFLYPVITPGSKEASANIWCAKDPAQAWKTAMFEGKPAPQRDAKCDITVLDRNIKLGEKLGITGTPTIFVPSGMRVPGAAGIEYLEKMLNASRR